MIDGRFKKAELDNEDTEVAPRYPRLYELTAVREIQEADGKMKPAELDTAGLKPGSPMVTDISAAGGASISGDGGGMK